MGGSNVNAGDDMVRRLEVELREKQNFANEILARVQASNRDLSNDEKELLAETRGRIGQLKEQMDLVEDYSKVAFETSQRQKQIGLAMEVMKGKSQVGPVEYRSAGQYVLDTYKSAMGDRQAAERLEMFYRAADHQKTADNLGIVPDPIIGDVVNYIDAARPIVAALGPRNLPSATWHRPKVTQHTSVGPQGSAGAAADQKAELVSQKMTITRLTANAVTYGGYVNVAKQNIDFSQPSVLDLVVNDLAAQYAIETEGATAALLATTATTAVTYDVTPAAGDTVAGNVAGAIWAAAAKVYTAVRGQGRMILAIAPDRLTFFGPLFNPVNPQNAQSQGLSAVNYGQGVLGTISGIPVVMSSQLASGEAFLFSTAAVEVYEQRVGTLQVTEPSVLGVQVAYAGYFTPLMIEDDAVVPVNSTT